MPVSASEKLDQELARSALEKQRSGRRPDSREQAALRRLEKRREEETRWQYYESLPQKHYVAMSGRQWKVLAEQAERHGLPIVGKVLSLPKIVKAFHDFLAANKHRLAAANGEDPLMAGEGSPALERYRTVRADQEELKLAEMRRELLPRSDIHAVLIRGMSIVRRSMETLQRAHGDDAMAIVSEALEEAERVLDSLAIDDDGSDSSSDTGAGGGSAGTAAQ